MPRTGGPVRRPGFTLIELMTSVVLFLGLMALVLPFFRQQSLVIERQGSLLDAVQSARFANTVIDRELRAAGGETGQPIIVQAGPMAITFNANLVSRVADDPRATYFNPDADSLATEVWLPARAKVLPLSAKQYPAVTYTDNAGNPSSAETISFWLSRDLTAPRNDIYTLWRRANDRDSTVVARNFIVPDSARFAFRYWRADSVGNLLEIPRDSLPLFWDGTRRWIDSIRVVGMRLSAIYREPRTGKEIIRTVANSTKLNNAGLLQQLTCGTEPLEPSNVTVTLERDPMTDATVSVRVAWDASVEESAGERDVAAYVVVRRLDGATDWETLGNVVARGLANYQYDDFAFVPGNWIYGVMAQDCNPSNSPLVNKPVVVTP